MQKNNLNRSLSPYLRQHADNPVHWQEWCSEALNYAKDSKRLLIVSSGYSACHWCHVMAENTFSKKEVADYVNSNFVAVKLDREERPDIDHFLMSFMTEHFGHGGWPLNVILSPDLKPIYAFTYADAGHFISILQEIERFYNANRGQLMHYMPYRPVQKEHGGSIIDRIYEYYDNENKGFHSRQKFPPHSTILFLLHHYQLSGKRNEKARRMAFETLDKMSSSGLYDPVGGGFFRYCTDRQWIIPHFEKMMYDQAMHIMNYSAAYILSGEDKYRQILKKTLSYIESQKSPSGLYYTALDADTDKKEGASYLWDREEIDKARIDSNFKLVPFEGKFHLIKHIFNDTGDIEKRLEQLRKEKNQPLRDEKILTSVNCLLAVGFYYSYMALKDKEYLHKALLIYNYYKKCFQSSGNLQNIELDGKAGLQDLLENYAALLVLATFVETDVAVIRGLRQKMLMFQVNGEWFSSLDTELGNIPAGYHDHPVPSPAGLAKMGLVRSGIILGESYEQTDDQYLQAHISDYYNLAVLTGKSSMIIHTNEILEEIPLNALQIKADHYQICYEGRCSTYNSKKELLENLFKINIF